MTTEQENLKPDYDESSFAILEGLEPVKLRPGQFTHTDSPLHIAQEVIDNAVDEALAGFARNITVTLQADNGVTVEDDGRGIPVGMHKEKKVSVIEAAFGILYAGGKFNKKDAKSAYAYSGGLHGVGVAVTNALSEYLTAEVRREGKRWRIGFTEGVRSQPLTEIGNTRGTGTKVSFKPNPKYFQNPLIPEESLRVILRSKAALLPGLKVTLRNERNKGEPTEEVWCYDKGLVSLLQELSGNAPSLVAVIENERFADGEDEGFSEGEGAAWAFSWYEGSDGPRGQSFVNLINTPQHGTHVAGLRSAIFETLKIFIEHHGLMPKGVKLSADDIFRNVCFVLSAKILDPSFANQTKDQLISRDGVKLVEKMIRPSLEAWFNLNATQGKLLAEMAIRHAMARQRASTKVERKRTTGVVMLPGKLSDCESADPAYTELFLVEGDSAGGSAKMARNKECQAILPLRGKGLNTWEKERVQALENEEIADIATAMGIPAHATTDTLDWSKLRYGKVCIMADADVDGFHIQVLLLTLFFRHFPQLIERGHIYVARPPLYRLDVEGSGKKRPAKKVYAMDENELRMWEDRLRKEGYANPRVGRFKGLGEMDPVELWDTTLNPDTRRLLQIALPDAQKTEAVETFDNLMRKNKAGWRREWMERRGGEVTL